MGRRGQTLVVRRLVEAGSRAGGPSSRQPLTCGHPKPAMTVPSSDYHDPRLTEQRNPRTQRIDVASSLEIVDLSHAADAPAPPAVHRARAGVARPRHLG